MPESDGVNLNIRATLGGFPPCLDIQTFTLIFVDYWPATERMTACHWHSAPYWPVEDQTTLFAFPAP